MWNVMIPTLAAPLVVLGAIDAGALPFWSSKRPTVSERNWELPPQLI